MKRDHIEFLEELRISGIVHMHGMAPYLKEAFGITIEEAQETLDYFIENYLALDKEFNWEEREKREELKMEKFQRLHDVYINYNYYEHIIASSQEEPSWFSEDNITCKFTDVSPDKARELLRGFVRNFDLIEAKYFFDTLTEESGADV